MSTTRTPQIMREEALEIVNLCKSGALPVWIKQLAEDVVELVDYLAPRVNPEPPKPRPEPEEDSFIFHASPVAYENDKVVAIRQEMEDGTTETFAVGDNTDIGIIVGFERAKATPPFDLWYALGNRPSEWQKDRGMEHSWSWIYLLTKVTD